MKTWIVALVLALLPLAAGAFSREEALKVAESSLLVKGSIQTHADGSVSALLIDQPEKFPASLVDFVRKQVMEWKFEPVVVDGKAMPARSPFSLRLVARVLDKDKYSLAIRNASFHGEPAAEGEAITRAKAPAPRYPAEVLSSGATGSVYVVVKIGRDGRVVDSTVEQVNLRTLGTEKQMAKWRAQLGEETLRAVRNWRYNPPVKGEQADDEFWLARVPVDFVIDRKAAPAYGKWEMYIPGPRQSLPWSYAAERPAFSPDLLAEGGTYLLGQAPGLTLLTPLGGS